MGKKARMKREAREAAKAQRQQVFVVTSPFHDVQPGERGTVTGGKFGVYRVAFPGGRVHLFRPQELTRA